MTFEAMLRILRLRQLLPQGPLLGFHVCPTTTWTKRLDRESRSHRAMGPRLRWKAPPNTKRPKTAGFPEQSNGPLQGFGTGPY